MPVPKPSELQAFMARTLQEASYKSQEAMLEATWRMDDLPRFPDLPMQPGAFDDVETEEELRQKIAEQKLLVSWIWANDSGCKDRPPGLNVPDCLIFL